MGTAIGHGSAVLAIGLIVLLVWWLFTSYKRKPTLVGKWISAKKQGVCPLITFGDTQDLDEE